MITKVNGPLTYYLKLPNTWKIHNNFHAILLTRYEENKVHGPSPKPLLPDLEEGEEQYEVETIISHRQDRHGRWYLIKWKGYPISENTWEPMSNLKKASETIEEYNRKHGLGSSVHRTPIAQLPHSSPCCFCSDACHYPRGYRHIPLRARALPETKRRAKRMAPMTILTGSVPRNLPPDTST